MLKILKLLFAVCLIFISQIICAAQSYTTLLTVDVIRHGDRTATINIPNAPHEWREGLGQLTAEGMHQLCELGNQFRIKYIDQQHLLPSHYVAKSLFVRSTNYDRTLMSANAFLNCLYPPHTGPKILSGEFALPEGIQPIPIHTVENSQDELLLNSSAHRAEFAKLLERNVYAQSHWIEKEKLMEMKLQKWSIATGYPLNKLQDIMHLGDALYIYQLYQLSYPPALSKMDVDEMIALAEWVVVERVKPYVIGEFIAKAFWAELKRRINEQTTNPSSLKSIIYFAHDTTILGFFSALHIPLNNIPPYAADLRFELLEDAQKTHWIRVSYNGKNQKLPHCYELCTLSQFMDLIR